MPGQLEAYSWAALKAGWILQWTLILVVGVLPAEFFKRLFRVNKQFWCLCAFRVASFIVVGLCLLTGDLLRDTYALEQLDPRAVMELACDAVLDTSEGSAKIKVTCPAETPWFLPTSSVDKLGPGTLYLLRASRIPVAFKSLA